MQATDLPTVNAFLNGMAALLLVAGFAMIRSGRPRAHRACMLGAFATSALFLVSYLVYHARVGSVPFQGQGVVRVVYFVILISHIFLAAAIVPMALLTLAHALRERFDRHARLARWTLPIWLYVSVTGVVVYVMLYRSPWS